MARSAFSGGAIKPRGCISWPMLHAFDARVSRLLTHPPMLVSYAACDLHVLTRIPTRDRFPMHEKFARKLFHAIATSTHTITMSVNLR